MRNILFLVLCNIPLKCSLKIFQGSNDMGITVFECPSWNSGQLTVDKRVLLDVINEVKTAKTYQEGRIIILSRYCTQRIFSILNDAVFTVLKHLIFTV